MDSQQHRSVSHPERRSTVAAWLTATVATLVAGVSAAGLWAPGLYTDGAEVEAMFRGYDLVTLAVIAPLLALTLLPTTRDEPPAILVRTAMLAYCLYNYAYYLFGAELNAALLVHIAIFIASLYALVLSLIAVDVASLADRFRSRTPVRTAAIILTLLGGGLMALQLSGLAAFALTGAIPEEPSRLIVPATFTRLGAVLDLSLLVPLYLLGVVWLWRRLPWGYVLAPTVLLAGALHQISYVSAMLFQMAAEIPDASFDPFEPVILALYAVGTILLLAGLRPQTRAAPPRVGDGKPVVGAGAWS